MTFQSVWVFFVYRNKKKKCCINSYVLSNFSLSLISFTLIFLLPLPCSSYLSQQKMKKNKTKQLENWIDWMLTHIACDGFTGLTFMFHIFQKLNKHTFSQSKMNHVMSEPSLSINILQCSIWRCSPRRIFEKFIDEICCFGSFLCFGLRE